MQPSSSEQVGNPSAAKMGEAEFETSDNFPNEVWETIHGYGGAHESVLSLLVESSQPGCDGGGSEAEVPSGLCHVPTAGGLECQDGEALDGREVRPPPWIDAGHASVFDPQLFAQQRNLALEPLDLPTESDALDRAVGTPAADEGQRPMGSANDVKQRGARIGGPTIGDGHAGGSKHSPPL